VLKGFALDETTVWVLGFVATVVVAAAVGLHIYLVRKRLEEERDRVINRLGEGLDKDQLSKLSRVEREIYKSELLWSQKEEVIRNRLFKEISTLVDSVERFNRSLSQIPSFIDERIPQAITATSRAFDSSSDGFRQASNTFVKAAEGITVYGDQYVNQLSMMENSLREFNSRKSQFDQKLSEFLERRLLIENEAIERSAADHSKWQGQLNGGLSELLTARLSAEKAAVGRLDELMAKFEREYTEVLENRLDAERELVQAIRERAGSIRNGRLTIGD